DRVAALERRYARHRPAAEHTTGQLVVEGPPGKSRDLPVVRKVKDVGAVKWQNAPAPSSRVERVHERRPVALVRSRGSQRFAKGISRKVLEVLASLPALPRL